MVCFKGDPGTAGRNAKAKVNMPRKITSLQKAKAATDADAVKAKEGETNALKPINKGFAVAGALTLAGTLALSLVYVGNDNNDNAGWKCFGAVAIGCHRSRLACTSARRARATSGLIAAMYSASRSDSSRPVERKHSVRSRPSAPL